MSIVPWLIDRGPKWVQNYMNNLCRPECRILLFRAFRPYRLWANSSTSGRARHFLTFLATLSRAFPLARDGTCTQWQHTYVYAYVYIRWTARMILDAKNSARAITSAQLHKFSRDRLRSLHIPSRSWSSSKNLPACTLAIFEDFGNPFWLYTLQRFCLRNLLSSRRTPWATPKNAISQGSRDWRWVCQIFVNYWWDDASVVQCGMKLMKSRVNILSRINFVNSVVLSGSMCTEVDITFW